MGKFGPFIEYDVEGEKAHRQHARGCGAADVNLEFIEQLKLDAKRADEPISTDPVTGLAVFVRKGRFGPYVQLRTTGWDKPKRSSLMQVWRWQM